MHWFGAEDTAGAAARDRGIPVGVATRYKNAIDFAGEAGWGRQRRNAPEMSVCAIRQKGLSKLQITVTAKVAD